MSRSRLPQQVHVCLDERQTNRCVSLSKPCWFSARKVLEKNAKVTGRVRLRGKCTKVSVNICKHSVSEFRIEIQFLRDTALCFHCYPRACRLEVYRAHSALYRQCVGQINLSTHTARGHQCVCVSFVLAGLAIFVNSYTPFVLCATYSSTRPSCGRG